jgi:predicted helicase
MSNYYKINFNSYLENLQKNLKKGSERSHYPALKSILDDRENHIEAIIEEKGNKAGIPDFTVKKRDLLLGYVEAKDIGLDLNKVTKTEQIQRYLESHIGSNFLLTNYLEFRWYVNSNLRLTSIFATKNNDELVIKDVENTKQLIESFLSYRGEIINNPEDLAQQLARLTKAIRYAVIIALESEDITSEIHQLKKGFQEVLLPDLDNLNFADMYSQTISYGLFTARVSYAQNSQSFNFERRTASLYISDTNPFLKRLFDTLFNTNSLDNISWVIDDLVTLLARVDMSNILADFGKKTRQYDPIVHFYETFLGAYDSALRKSRGVYYTPQPVVSFIVKSVDLILKNKFNLPLGLADNTKDKVTQKPRVQILDPATGTGTFLYEVINQIYANLETVGLTSQWNNYVKDNLLERVFGFELLMAPYAIAHLKLGLQLQNLNSSQSSLVREDKGGSKVQRLGIYLTNTLDEALKKSELLFGQFVANEANEASAIKRDYPIMVVLGNPPYSGHSANKNKWIEGLVKDYYFVDNLPLNERNPKWLQDDYVKFIRFGQWRISQTGFGILAFVTNHGFLDNPTFRGMRQNLMQSFNEIYVLDLHGNAKKKEVSPSGSVDKNVFDIQQGVSINIFIKQANNGNFCQVYHGDLWGSRNEKYTALNELNIGAFSWQKINPISPFYLFKPQNTDLLSEYNQGLKITEIMPVNSVGIVTGKDIESIAFSYDDAVNLCQKHKINQDKIFPILYRTFDVRFIVYDSQVVTRTRSQVMHNMLRGDNLGLVCTRQQSIQGDWSLIGVANQLIESSYISNKTAEINSLFPLYIYPNTENGQNNLFETRKANFSPEFLTAIQKKLGYIPTPEKIFYYIYTVFHSPTYRQRYAEFLKIDFPCLLLTSDDNLFNSLAKLGEELVKLHLMESPKLSQLITQYQGTGESLVSQVTYNPKEERVYINKNRYFTGINRQIWEFKIGGYQVLDKWLKDRKKANRSLSFDDIFHYQKIVVALTETQKIMIEIDANIPSFPIR